MMRLPKHSSSAGSSSADAYYEDLVQYVGNIREQSERHIREGLSEDELEIYDLLKKDKLTRAEEQRVKLAAKDLIIRLLEGHPKVLVQDWWKDGQTQRAVKAAIEEVLDKDLPESYDRVAFKEKCDNVFELVVEFAATGRKWVA
ncbi:type I restriction enzyme endonuclease domain-containing protein [Marinobacter sp. VGCF2001]|uniref:type I restriction enzyme endonuclease domain-containing protein n=1 Tax=Marinobacter sp. VGCF2001 TaxID=3417189 RepID=UPI003CF25865